MIFRHNTSHASSGFPMAAMLDIMFLLLIHFMAATIFAQWENKLDIKVPTATSAKSTARQPGEVILNIDKNGTVFINSLPVPEDTLAKLLKDIADTFRTQPVILRADQETTCQQLLHVLDICRQADIINIAFATIKPPQEKQE